jgi:hypothetical protein
LEGILKLPVGLFGVRPHFLQLIKSVAEGGHGGHHLLHLVEHLRLGPV